MNITLIGLGYMGLPMAAILARAGHKVHGVDINPAVVARVNKGECPFAEPGMSELVAEAHASGNLHADTAPVPADIFLLSLPTPVDHTTHEADMSYVEAGAAAIAPVLKEGDLVILESTSPLGGTEVNVKAVVEKTRPELADKIDYVFCPERAIPGDTLREMVENDRLVGGLSERATERGLELYKTFCKGELIPCTAGEAEMVKLVENASRDAQLAFCNELHMVCDKLGLDFWRVVKFANHHPRVNIFTPNAAGVGGHCIAVDPWFIVHSAPEIAKQMRATREVNDSKPLWVAGKVREAVRRMGKDKVTVACLGLAYKPDVDDLRDSPGAVVIDELANDSNLELLVVEPNIDSWRRPLTPLGEAIARADVVVCLTAHKPFRALTSRELQGKQLVDACGVWRHLDGVTNVI
ncbi:MAG: nucleotide sugar dehydrogenase [Pseudomonadaceae bacterium]|nr:nucleotide sugar dehydrogenase [Pseudomonadaceae bacterium]